MFESSACAGRFNISPIPSSWQHARQYEKPSPESNNTSLCPPRLRLRIHPDRTSCRHRHHRDFGGAAAAVIGPSQAEGSGHLLHEQYLVRRWSLRDSQIQGPHTTPVLKPGQLLPLNQNLPNDLDILWMGQHAAGLSTYP